MSRFAQGSRARRLGWLASVALALALLAPAASGQVVEALLVKQAAKAAPAAKADPKEDALLTRLVHSQLKRQGGLENVTAKVESSVAQLDGQVMDLEQRDRAAEVAAGVAGVERVVNRVLVDANVRLRVGSAFEEARTKTMQLLVRLPLLLLAALLVMLSAWIGGALSRRLRWLRIHSKNPYMDALVRRVVQTVAVLCGVLLALDLLGWTSLVGAVLGSAGLIGLVLGFAFKDIAENYVSGILLSLRRPFAPGDTIVIEGREGTVVSLNSRTTVLMTPEGHNLQLPNALVFKSVVLNYSRNPKRRFDFATAVSTSASWHDALELGISTISAMDGVLADPAPAAKILDIDPYGATLRFTGWIDQRDNDLSKIRSEAMRLVRRALRKADITPPEPIQRIQLVRNEAPEVVHDAAGAEQRDTSVDRAVDKQLEAARSTEGGKDLLDTTPAPDAQQADAPST